MGRSSFLQRENYLRSKSAPPRQSSFQKKLGILHREISIPRPDSQAPAPKYLPLIAPSVPGPSQAQGQEGSFSREPQGGPQALNDAVLSSRANALPTAPAQDRPLDRCVFVWLGSTHRQRPLLPRSMVKTGGKSTHQHLGSPSSNQGVRVSRPLQHSHLLAHRQRGGEICHQQAQIKGTSTLPLPFHAVSSPQTPHPQHHCLQDPVLHEPDSRCAQPGPSAHDGMVSPSGDFQQDHSMERTRGGRPDGNSLQQKGRNVRVSSSTSSGCHRCENSRLEQMESGVHLPPEEVHHAAPSQAPVLQVPRSSHRSLATRSSLVPRTLPKGRRPLTSAHSARTICTLRKNLKWLPKLRTMDRLQFLREVYTATRGPKVANSLVHALRKSSINQAQTAWRAFKEWLPEHLTVLRKRHVLEFLVSLKDNKKLSPWTILGYRHSLSIPFKEAFDINFADKDFSLLAKAQFHLSPPVQKKIPKWSLNHALETLQTPRFRNNSASLEDLFLKTIFLVAIASGNRCSELAACIREGISFEGNKVTIPTKEGFLFKNQTMERTPPPVSFPSMATRHQLCPASALSSYLEKSSHLPHKDTLFVHPKSGCPLLSGRLSYWIAKAIFTFDRRWRSLAFTRARLLLPSACFDSGHLT